MLSFFGIISFGFSFVLYFLFKFIEKKFNIESNKRRLFRLNWFSALFYNTIFDQALSKEGKFRFSFLPPDRDSLLVGVVHYYFVFCVFIIYLRVALILLRLNKGWIYRTLVGVPSHFIRSITLTGLPYFLMARTIFLQYRLPRNYLPFLLAIYIPIFMVVGLFQMWIPGSIHLEVYFDPQSDNGNKIVRGNKQYTRKLGKGMLANQKKNTPQTIRELNEDLFQSDLSSPESVDQMLGHSTESRSNETELDNEKKEIANSKTHLLNKSKSKRKQKTEAKINQLRICQITDPHLGVLMTKKRLYRICQKIVSCAPDLVFLTGDYLTFETCNTRGLEGLEYGLSPLRKIKSRCFAVLGNHDMEKLDGVIQIFKNLGIALLRNEQRFLKINDQIIQLIGVDWFRPKKRVIQSLMEEQFPIKSNIDLRVILSHHPSVWKYIDNNDKSITFSGHTHGGVWGFGFLGMIGSALRLFVLDEGVSFYHLFFEF
ncbi:transmembrane protein with metallophosphoesterase domain-related [Anaeramoeba flamelloides]|uniref:Transmembrane protein with metallophosphoesterase domain-related n=1 Tax=Anaeramoeba flamelloides TaxID=1746091 RepID=A0ABQ8XLX0_9EUKA|nr:transmembrane protein with metallophosphoesterase domain-related [Anaeramoeba flamelloides]